MSDKVPAFFSRSVFLYVFTEDEKVIDDGQGFDAVPIEVDPDILGAAREIRQLIEDTEDSFLKHPAPEECAQLECDEFSARIRDIVNA